MLSERSQTQWSIYCKNPIYNEFKNRQMNLVLEVRLVINLGQVVTQGP